MTDIDRALSRAADLLDTIRLCKDDRSRAKRQHDNSTDRLHSTLTRPYYHAFTEYEVRRLFDETESLEQEEHQAWMRLHSARSELDKVAHFLREQITASPHQAAEIASVLNQHDKSGDQYLARVREQAVQTSIANARAEWNRTRSPAARQQLVAVLAEHQKWNDLLPLALEDVRNAPNDRRARQLLASVYEHLGKREDLLTLLKQDLASAPGDAALRRRIAELLVQMGRYDEAIGQLQQDVTAARPEPWAADLMAQALERAKKTDALIHFLRGQVKSDPANAQWRQKLGAVLEQERRWDELIVFLRDQVKSHPTETQWRQKLYSVLEQNQRWNDLISLYEQDISRNPGDVQLRERVAVFYRKSGRLDELLNLHLLPAAKQAPTDFPPKQAVVEAFLDAQRDTDVLGYIKQELAASQAGAAFLSRFVAVLAKRRRSDLVEPVAMSCLPPSLGRTDAYMEIARGYRQNDEVKAALAFLDSMGQRFPDDKAIGDLPTAFLVESLVSPSSTTRAFVGKQLYARPDKARAIGALKELFATTNDVNVQLDVLAALVEIQKAEALPFLKASLSHSSKEVRREAAKALGQLGDKRAKRPLRRQLKVEQDASVQTALKDALHRIDPKAKEHPPLKAGLVIKAMIGGGLLGAFWGWLQTIFVGFSGSSSDLIITLILGAVFGAIIIGIPIDMVRPRKKQKEGCLASLGVEAVIGGFTGIAIIFIVATLSRSGMLPIATLGQNIFIIMSATIVAVLSVPVVIALNTDRLWILPATGLVLVAVAIPLILAATFDQSSSSPQNEAMVVATGTATPVMAATRSDSTTPRPSPSVPAGVPATAQSAKVMSVSDGHAIRVELVDGTATIRYAGLLVPTGDMMGADSAAQASRELLSDPWVWLETTSFVPAGADVEVYIWLADGTLANLQLVEMGYALPDPALEDDSLASQLQQAAREAWQAQAGFWAGGADVAPWAVVVVDVANIRQGPGTDRPVVAQALRGDIFVINGRNANGDWLQIQASDAVTAWIFAELAQTTTPISSLPVVLP